MPGRTYAIDLLVQEQKKGAGRVTEDRGSTARAIGDNRPPQQPSTRHGKQRKKPHAKPPVEDECSTSSSGTEDEHDCCGLDNFEDAWRYPMYSPSASYRQVDVVSGSHQYTISGFPLARSMGCGTRLCSDFFEVCGQLFRLEVYPGGFTADTRRFVSVFLTTPGSVNPNHVMYELAILDQSGKDKHIVERRGSYSHQQFGSGLCHMHGPVLAYSRGIVAALPKFIKAKFLREHCQRYMPCGMLVLRATVQVLRGWSSTPTVHGHVAYAAGPTGGAFAPSPAAYGAHAGGNPQLLGSQSLAPYMPAPVPYPVPASYAPQPFGMPGGFRGQPFHAPHSGQWQLMPQVPSQQLPVQPSPAGSLQAFSSQPGGVQGVSSMFNAQAQQPQQPMMYSTPQQSGSYAGPVAAVHGSPQYASSAGASWVVASPSEVNGMGVRAQLVREAEPRYLVYMASPTT